MPVDSVTYPSGNTYNRRGFHPDTNPRGLANGGTDVLWMDMCQDQIEVGAAAAAAAITAEEAATAATEAAVSVETDVTIATAAAAAAAASAIAAEESKNEAAAIAGGGIKITPADTTYKLLNDALTVTAPLTKTVAAPAGNEKLNLALDLTARPSMAQILWQQIFS